MFKNVFRPNVLQVDVEKALHMVLGGGKEIHSAVIPEENAWRHPEILEAPGVTRR